MTKQTLIQAIAPEKQADRGWSAEINGSPVAEISHLRLSNPKYGQFEYGATPAGFDSWAFHENKGGGSVILPYALIAGNLYIGCLQQNRPNQGGKVLNVPRGFLALDENHFQAAQREFSEEVGLVEAFAVVQLPGQPANPNSAFFDTRGDGEGVKFFAVRIPAALLEQKADSAYHTLKQDAVRADPASKAKQAAEQILSAEFLPWITVAQLSDMFSVAGAARLKALLERQPPPAQP